MASIAFQLRAAWHPVVPIYLNALAATVLLPLVGPLPRGATGPSRAIARAMLVIAFLGALGTSMPADRTAMSAPDAPRSLSLADDRTDAGMTLLEQAQPGFAQLRQGNPALYAEIRAVMQRFYGDQIGRAEADREIARLIDHAYLTMLPSADSGLLIEGLRIRLERLQRLRATAPAACASGDSEKTGPAMPEALRDRRRMEIFNVLSSPPETVTTGRIINSARIATRAAAAEHVDQATLLDRLTGRKGVDAACAARIAVTQALLDSDSVDDIAATLRDQYRREQPPETSRPCRREDAQPLRPC